MSYGDSVVNNGYAFLVQKREVEDKEVQTMGTFWRDDNGNIREGVKWNLEMNDILVRFFGEECCYYRGFHPVNVEESGYLGGVFELDIDKKPTKEFLEFIKNYKSEHIKGIAYQKEIIMYGKPMYRNAVIALL